MNKAIVIISSMLFSTAAWAQQPSRPAPAASAPPPPPALRDRPGAPDRPAPPPPPPPADDPSLSIEERMRHRRQGEDVGPGGAGDPRMQRFDLMRGYLDAVDRYARMAHNPNHAGIAAVVAAADILKPRGADPAIEYFTKLLPEVKSPAVQRAVRLQLVELYKQAGKQDEALEQLKLLMTAEAEPPAQPNAPQ
jgi:hypothetical protein